MFEGKLATLIGAIVTKYLTRYVKKYFSLIFVLLISALLLAWFLPGLSPSSSLAWVAQRVGYSDTHWLSLASSSIRSAIRGGPLTGVSLVAAYSTCLAGVRPKAALFAGVSFLLAVEAAGTHAAILTGFFVAGIISVYGVRDAFRRNRPGGCTWPYVAMDTFKQAVLMVGAAPLFCWAVLAGSVKLLSDGWLHPVWSDVVDPPAK